MSNDSTKEHVGIVGVGRMGLAMLKHLVRHGHAVTACDLDEAQLAKARDAAAATVKTPAEVARAASFVIIGVGYDDEVNQVVLGPEGLLAALASEASGQRGDSMVRAPDTRPEPGSSARGVKVASLRTSPATSVARSGGCSGWPEALISPRAPSSAPGLSSRPSSRCRS
jgi:threonine dehydrogenase-like Zn-dependent dehydrogenase